MRKILIALSIIILMALSSAATFLYLTKKNVVLCKAALGFFSGEIAVAEGNHLSEISNIKNFSALMESVIKHKIRIIDIMSDHLEVFSIKNAITMDKSFLHLRLGFLYKKDGKKEMANTEFETALKMYNSVKDQPIDFEQMVYIYERLNFEKDK